MALGAQIKRFRVNLGVESTASVPQGWLCSAAWVLSRGV